MTHQETARALHLLLNKAGAEWTHGGSDGGVSCYSCSLIAAALATAESRGRAAGLREAADIVESIQPDAGHFEDGFKRRGELDMRTSAVIALRAHATDAAPVRADRLAGESEGRPIPHVRGDVSQRS